MPTVFVASSRLLLPVLLAALGGCGDGEVRYAIDDVRTEVKAGLPPPTQNSEERRFGAPHPSPQTRLGTESPVPRSRWAFDVPAGWTELPPAPMRDHGWRVGGDGRAECTLVVIGGAAGGLLANVNRWRRQISLPPIDDAAVAALPIIRWLGRDARRVTLDGAYVGMGGAAPVADARLIGLVASVDAGTAFLKLTGPAGVVAAEEQNFLALAASLRQIDDGSVPSEPRREEPADGPGLAWSAPEGWTRQAPKPMRVVTFSPAASPEVVVYVSILGGRAGGLRANLERWHREMGLPAPSASEVERLDRGTVLGGQGVYVALEGTFSGMGAGAAPGYGLLGMVLEREKGSVFVKMVGPAGAVTAERARFRAFCNSLRE